VHPRQAETQQRYTCCAPAHLAHRRSRRLRFPAYLIHSRPAYRFSRLPVMSMASVSTSMQPPVPPSTPLPPTPSIYRARRLRL
jgi:hypothetical protein